MSILASSFNAATWSDVFNYVPTLILTAGAAGVWITAYLRGWIIARGSHDETCGELSRERDLWKQLYLDEVAAHNKTREAMTAASQRSELALDQGKLIVGIVQAISSTAASHDPPAIPAPEQGGASGRPGRRSRSGNRAPGD